MEIRWNYEKLAGNKDYEELRTLVNSYERQAYTKLQLFLIQKLNLLMDQVMLNEDPSLQNHMLKKIKVWFKSHLGNFNLPKEKLPEKPKKVSFTPIKIKKSVEIPPKTEKPRNLNEFRFLQHKSKRVQHWGMERSRSNEDFLYRSEVKSLNSIRNPNARGLSPGHYSGKLKELCNKHRLLIDPQNIDLQKKYPRESLSIFSPSLNETEALKRKLANRYMGVNLTTIEPLITYNEFPGRMQLGKIVENKGLSPVYLPVGGEGLLKAEKFPHLNF